MAFLLLHNYTDFIQFLIFTTKTKNCFEQMNLIVIILYFKSSYQNYKTIKSKDKVSVIYY